MRCLNGNRKFPAGCRLNELCAQVSELYERCAHLFSTALSRHPHVDVMAVQLSPATIAAAFFHSFRRGSKSWATIGRSESENQFGAQALLAGLIRPARSKSSNT